MKEKELFNDEKLFYVHKTWEVAEYNDSIIAGMYSPNSCHIYIFRSSAYKLLGATEQYSYFKVALNMVHNRK